MLGQALVIKTRTPAHYFYFRAGSTALVGGVGGWATERRGLSPSEGETKNIYRLFLKPIMNNEQLGFDVFPKLLHFPKKVFPLRVVLGGLFGKIL